MYWYFVFSKFDQAASSSNPFWNFVIANAKHIHSVWLTNGYKWPRFTKWMLNLYIAYWSVHGNPLNILNMFQIFLVLCICEALVMTKYQMGWMPGRNSGQRCSFAKFEKKIVCSAGLEFNFFFLELWGTKVTGQS